MVDIHCHILSGIDDGAATLSESVALCRMAAGNAIRTVVATPHLARADEVDGFITLRNQKIDELRAQLDREGIEIEVLPGAEVFMSDDVFFAPDLSAATLNGSRYLLIEFEFKGLNINRIVKYVNEIFSRGLVPIIAHPERYYYMQENYDIVNHLADMGVLFQLNAPSLAGFSGFEAKELAFAMASNGIASFIGSDAHSVYHRPNDMLGLRERFPKGIDFYTYDAMLGENPRAILNNEEFSRGKMFSIRRKRFF